MNLPKTFPVTGFIGLNRNRVFIKTILLRALCMVIYMRTSAVPLIKKQARRNARNLQCFLLIPMQEAPVSSTLHWKSALF
jgi:hypothetical protein